MIYLATVPAPTAPLSAVHTALYSYFPNSPQGERPFVWRYLSRDRIAMLSERQPATVCKEIHVDAGRTYEFRLTYKRERICRGKPVEIRDFDDMRDRLKTWAEQRGAHVGFVRFDKKRSIQFHKPGHRVMLPIVDATGTVIVSAAALFERSILLMGGPGTAKAYGLGMWWLPEIMGIEQERSAT